VAWAYEGSGRGLWRGGWAFRWLRPTGHRRTGRGAQRVHTRTE